MTPCCTKFKGYIFSLWIFSTMQIKPVFVVAVSKEKFTIGIYTKQRRPKIKQRFPLQQPSKMWHLDLPHLSYTYRNGTSDSELSYQVLKLNVKNIVA